jgi:hypothetical protein
MGSGGLDCLFEVWLGASDYKSGLSAGGDETSRTLGGCSDSPHSSAMVRNTKPE